MTREQLVAALLVERFGPRLSTARESPRLAAARRRVLVDGEERVVDIPVDTVDRGSKITSDRSALPDTEGAA